MKIYIVSILFTFLSYSQYANGQVFEAPSPAPCEVCRTECIKAPGTYNGWNCPHTPECKYSSASNTKQQQSNILLQNLPSEMQQLNTLIDLFNTPNTDSKVLAEKEAARMRLTEKKALDGKKKYERNEKLKSELKPIEFVPFQQSSTPETMEERERRNLINKGLNVTWNEFEGGGYGSTKIVESEETAEQSESEKEFYERMKKIESYKLGKLAAFMGRSIYGIAREVNSYMLDASQAIVNSDLYTMKELADIDGKKLVVNGVVDGAKVTTKAYVEEGVSYVKGKLYSAAISHNIAMLKSDATTYFEKYKKEYPLANEWFKNQ